MKSLLAILRVFAFVLACAVLVAAAGLLVAERSGWIESTLRSDLARRLGPLGESLELREAQLHWFEPGLEIRGLSLGPGGANLRAESLRASFGWSVAGGTELRRLEVVGGHVRIDAELLDAIARLQASFREDSARAPGRGAEAGSAAMPELFTKGLQVELGSGKNGSVPLGLVDAGARIDAGGFLYLEGRIVPSLVAVEHPAEIAVTAQEIAPGRYEVHASTAALALSAETLPEGAEFDRLRKLSPSGLLDLDLRATVDLEALDATTAIVRASLREGSLRPAADAAPIEGLALELAAVRAPHAGQRLDDPASWEATLHCEATRLGAKARGWALLGRSAGADLSARAWLEFDELALVRADFLALGVDADALDALDAFGLSGRASGLIGLERTNAGALRWSADLEPGSEFAMRYRGFLGDDGKPIGFPVDGRGAGGRVVATFDPALRRPLSVAALGLAGDLQTRGPGGKGSPVHCDAVLRTALTGELPLEYDVRITGRDFAVGEALHQGVLGLDHEDWVWREFAPHGGSLDGEIRLQYVETDPELRAEFAIDVHQAGVAFVELPIPIERVSGRIRVRRDPRDFLSVGFDLEGSVATADHVRIRGHELQDPERLGLPFGERVLRWFAVSLPALPLRGAHRDAIAEQLPGVGTALDEFGATGMADVGFQLALERGGGPTSFLVEIVPRQVQLSPQAFQVQTRNVRGRVIVSDSVEVSRAPDAESTTETRIVPLTGDWAGGAVLAARGTFPGSSEPYVLDVAAAGLDVENRALVGALKKALAGANPGAGGIDLESLVVDGRVDFDGDFRIFPDARPMESRYRVELRENRLQVGTGVGIALEALRGALVQEDGVLHGEDLSARIGRTQVLLEEARFSERDGVYRLEARPSARGLPLDREHMRFFLDDATLDALEQGLHLGGTVDVIDASVSFTGSSASGPLVSFRGDVVPHQMQLDIGLPVRIDTARAHIRDLVFEQGEVRGWAEVEDLSGNIAGRRLAGARMLLTYVQPHLSILDLTGQLEGGAITDLGGAGKAGGPAFSIDLEEPYAFDLGLRLSAVDVAGLLRGLFESDFASSGRLSGNLRLAGSLDDLLGIQGRGEIDLTDSRLWSIPVVRDLFAQLGFETPATFESAKSRFEVHDGVIDMQTIYVRAPLLQLVGSGTLDLDGRLHDDLEVRYGLVDQLGPFRRLLYWIQNNLLRVSVRGDMSRPKVILRGALSFFQRSKSDRRDLPLPSFSPLPERF